MSDAGLLDAMANPHREGLDKHIQQLEAAIAFIKRHGFEYQLHHELIDANRLLLQLKKRYKIYAEILALDQPTVVSLRPLIVRMTGPGASGGKGGRAPAFMRS